MTLGPTQYLTEKGTKKPRGAGQPAPEAHKLVGALMSHNPMDFHDQLQG
jgi:hypothetical protein